jgi:dipeptidyl aminopeptidase/acylaminoacyl peptidase
MTIRVFVLMSLLATAPAVVAQQKRPMTFADLMAMKRVSDPQISASGKWVLFSVTEVDLEKNSKTNHLWVVPLEGSRVQGSGSRERSAEGVGAGEGKAAERQVTFGSGESNGRFSPDGKWVMYSANTAEGKGEIFVAPWDEAKGAVGLGRAVTSLETEADGGIWAPDSRHFLFVSDVYPQCEAKVAAGREHDQMEAECNAAADAEAAKSPVKALIFTELLYRHWDHFQGAKRTHLFWGVVEGEGPGPRAQGSGKDETQFIAEPKDLTPASVVGDHVAPTYSVGGPLGYAIAPDGREIAYEVNLDTVPAESTNNDIYVLDPEGDVHGAKKVSTSPGSDDGPQYSPDGKWLAWRSQARNGYESDKFDLVVMDRGTGKITNKTTAFDGWVDEFVWVPDGALIFTSAAEGTEPIFSIDTVTHDGKPQMLQDTLGGEFGDLQVLTRQERLRDGKVVPRYSVVATKMDVGRAAEVSFVPMSGLGVVFDMVAAPPVIKPMTPDDKPLTYLNDAIFDSLDLVKMESFWFAGANGTKVQGFLIRPPGFDPAKKYPLKFLIHGGPQGAWGDAWSYRWNPELFAADGYVVVMINPRGSTGYGQRFLEEVSGDWGGRPYIDLMKGLDYAEATYPFIDKSRECALGASYGGYMADWVLTHTDRFKCIVTHDGMYNPQSAFGTTEELWFNEWEFRPIAGARGQGSGARAQGSEGKGDAGDAVVEQGKPARPWDFYDRPAAEDPFRRWSPMMFIKNAKTPTLVVHSQRDYRLDVSEGMQLFTALQLLGVPSKMLYFPDEGHWVLKPQNSELWYRTVNDWCDRWTGSGPYAK